MSAQASQVIAIVDDDPSMLSAAASFVRSLGFEARLFDSAERFLGSEAVDEADCVISDVQMPGLDGLGLLDALRETGRRLPTILMTARPDAATRDRAMAGGAVCFLAKPFEGQAMEDCLTRALNDA